MRKNENRFKYSALGVALVGGLLLAGGQLERSQNHGMRVGSFERAGIAATYTSTPTPNPTTKPSPSPSASPTPVADPTQACACNCDIDCVNFGGNGTGTQSVAGNYTKVQGQDCSALDGQSCVATCSGMQNNGVTKRGTLAACSVEPKPIPTGSPSPAPTGTSTPTF